MVKCNQSLSFSAAHPAPSYARFAASPFPPAVAQAFSAVADAPTSPPQPAEEPSPPSEEPLPPSGFSPAQDTGSVLTRRDGFSIHCMTVIGQVEGHYTLGGGQKSTKYEHLIPMLAAVEESEQIDGLLVMLNTVGGDVEAGLAIAELIAGMTKPTVSLILGGGHSIGIPLAVAARRSFIVPSATMTIHPVRMNGLVLGVPQSFAYFERMQDRIDRFIAAHASVELATLQRLTMQTGDVATDMGSIIDGTEAVSYGIIDEIGSLSEAIAALKKMRRHS